MAYESRSGQGAYCARTPATRGPSANPAKFALVINLNKRFSHRYILGGNYTFAHATDNQLGIFSLPSDSFVGHGL